MKRICFLVLVLCVALAKAQDDSEAAKKLEEAKNSSINYTYTGNEDLKENEYIQAEANYRRAISDYEDNTTAKFNLGNAYYSKETYDEAELRYKQAAEVATSKSEKHKAFHNLGNVYMKDKNYQGAVDAYKKALMNNPSDDETRYNYALAKEMLEKQKQDNKDKGGDQNKDDQNKKDQDKQDQNKQDQNKQDQNKKQDDQNGENKKDDPNKGDQENKDKGQGKDQQQKPDKPKDGQPPQQSKSKASPEQIKRMLKAIEQEDKNTQKKQNAKKVKGIPVKVEKDW
ncbi:BatC protein [Neptunitalea chrysea]|uniref:BatC protein n=1 Tax=Neptunitalea chrysea TaxID=1647581 RepID=A0A9W6B8D4_9FLAO|nr:tetratricopeptide repeat protein [Neptunitalea chrysea]GLB52723.1 BatC protein [Neptunitalea chrysea]